MNITLKSTFHIKNCPTGCFLNIQGYSLATCFHATTSTLIQSGGYYNIQNWFCEVIHITKLIICVEVMCRFHRVLDVSTQAVDQYPWESLHCDDQIMGVFSVTLSSLFSMLLHYLSSEKLHFISSVWLGAVFLLLR